MIAKYFIRLCCWNFKVFGLWSYPDVFPGSLPTQEYVNKTEEINIKTIAKIITLREKKSHYNKGYIPTRSFPLAWGKKGHSEIWRSLKSGSLLEKASLPSFCASTWAAHTPHTSHFYSSRLSIANIPLMVSCLQFTFLIVKIPWCCNSLSLLYVCILCVWVCVR